ncbi:MAG: dTDP-4-dehydrorhamnose 3,5-epimerase [Cyanobacteria bacterium J003]|uniref:dTDP-4-dehydrorhamnose 3,5-epimerase n=1 Tax=Thermosynechococcus sp. M3746_W2019_013 TaxID=2747806 RepID=UPI000F2565C7|nr:dTDP-4-dehydrorhamnose 3,5-epimerase [Thermosynechococcus sp. M3746_W2019_013]RMH64233.1 MAG: dTDP-4-dehydrorhamnose 3,5-epimerase [Cyanobacteria bacterium J003]HIK22229.1 dTDP-4-dehydrorhamnose 3,5-epimerase [Thermosynechococcus sp. M3746_W2019_013]
MVKVQPLAIADVLLLELPVFRDQRGFFLESFNQRAFMAATGLAVNFVQDNHSASQQGVLRGLHYQRQHPQGKLVRVIEGEIFDVAVDLRRSSPTWGQWVGTWLRAENFQQLWIPPGFAHGFWVKSPKAQVLYKTTDYYNAGDEYTLLWNDPTIGITWPIDGEPLLSAKDQQGKSINELPLFP